MWSGPRNISTAMMRSFENRPDTFVSDEPFYGYYLNNTDIDHPGKKEVLRSMECDWHKVVDYITGIIPEGASLWYQKHMAQHNLPGVDLSWIGQVTNCFLIRDPKEVILSYSKKYEVTRSELLGFSQQVELYRKITEEIGEDPVIIDARDVLHDPKNILQKFCEAVGIPFMDEMLSWPAGPRDTGGVWQNTGTVLWKHQHASNLICSQRKNCLLNKKRFMRNVSYIMTLSIAKGFIDSWLKRLTQKQSAWISDY